MRSIIDKIKESIEEVVGANGFHYNDGDGLNIDLDNAQYPCAFAQLIEAGALEDRFGQYHERVSLGIFFANVADIDLDPVKNERIITQLKQHALVWLASLRNNDELKLIDVRGTDRVYIKTNDYDVRLTAYVVNVELEEVQGFGVCDLNKCHGCSSSNS